MIAPVNSLIHSESSLLERRLAH